MERTFLALKPDCVQRGVCGEIISRFEKRGFKLIGMKFMQPTVELAAEHYAEHKGKPFFNALLEYLTSGPVIAMIWEGKGVVEASRLMIGATNPIKSAPGTIRGDFCVNMGRNIIHGSDGVESAKREISLWFKPEEQMGWKKDSEKWFYE